LFGQRSNLNILGEVWPSAEFVNKDAEQRLQIESNRAGWRIILVTVLQELQRVPVEQ
jgi:hypothetical protein